MGSLKPGATYIYEKADGVTYAREFGADPSTRQVVGWDYNGDDPKYQPTTSVRSDLDDHNEWIKIRLAGKKNPALQEAIERVKILYHLSNKDGQK